MERNCLQSTSVTHPPPPTSDCQHLRPYGRYWWPRPGEEAHGGGAGGRTIPRGGGGGGRGSGGKSRDGRGTNCGMTGAERGRMKATDMMVTAASGRRRTTEDPTVSTQDNSAGGGVLRGRDGQRRDRIQMLRVKQRGDGGVSFRGKGQDHRGGGGGWNDANANGRGIVGKRCRIKTRGHSGRRGHHLVRHL